MSLCNFYDTIDVVVVVKFVVVHGLLYKKLNVDSLVFVSFQTWVMVNCKLPSSSLGSLVSPLSPAKYST